MIKFKNGMTSDFSLKTLSIALKNSGKYQKLKVFVVRINFFQALYKEVESESLCHVV
jgi:hypothetical protein